MDYTTLVDGATLQQHLDDPAWCVVDLRHQLADTAYGERAYAAAHIPGSASPHHPATPSGAAWPAGAAIPAYDEVFQGF